MYKNWFPSIILFCLNLAKKTAKKEEQERKKAEALAKKKEREELAKQEEKELSAKKVNPVKVSQAKIREENEKRAAAARKASTKPEAHTHLTQTLHENVNR